MKRLKIYSRILGLVCLLAFTKTAMAQSPCQPTIVTVSNTNGVVSYYAAVTNSTNLTLVSWYFGNGATFTSSTSVSASTTYSANGVYTVYVSYYDAANTCSAVASQTILISGVTSCSLNASFISNSSQGTYTFISTSTGTSANTTYSWNFGDGATGTGSVAVHTYTTDWVYNPTLTIDETTPNACSSTIFNNIVVCTMPAPTITSINGLNGTIDFSCSVSSNTLTTSFNWIFGDGTYSPISYSPTMNHTYLTNGSFPVTLYIYSFPCSLTVQYTVTVSNSTNPCNINANFTNSTPSNAIVNFVNTSTGTSGGVTYTWNFGDGSPASGAVNPSHTYATTGFYVVSLTANNNYSYTCVDTQTYQIWVPTCTFVPTFTATNGANGSVSFLSNITGTAVSTTWYFGDGSPVLNYVSNPTHNYTTDGTYTVFLLTNSYGCSNTITAVVTITGCNADATFSMSPSGTPQLWNAFPASPGNVASATWYWGDGSTSNTLFTSHTYSAAGNYSICLMVISNCGDSSNFCMNYAIYKPAKGVEDMGIVQVNVLDPATVGIKNNSTNSALFNISPNPGNGTFALNLSGLNAEHAVIKVYNLVGQELYKTDVDIVGGTVTKELQLSDVANGVYLVKVTANQHTLTKKVVITKN